MPVKNINPLKPTSNVTIANTIRNTASTDYRARIPKATQGSLRETMQHLHNNRPLMNEFMDALVNRIGSVIARNYSWSNPLSEFKRGMLSFGDTIEEINTGLLKAHIYDPDREYLERDIFGTELAPAEANFHKVNRRNFYKVTVNEALLKNAFLEDGGLQGFISSLMEAPVTSDNWDEFLMTCGLISEYESNGGFYHMRIGDVADLASDEAAAKHALRRMRALADTLPFVSTKYNAAHMPTFARREELIILASPEFQAALDVEALAGAFNVSKADMYGRVVTIPQENFGVDGCQAILTTKDFFVIADQLIENRTADNPVSLNRNYFLHHWQVISASRFVPAVMLHAYMDDEIVAVRDPEVTGISAITFDALEDGTIPTSAPRGDMTAFVATGITDPADAPNTGVMWTVTGGNSTQTFITPQGVLHVGPDETATTVTVTARTVWFDPSDTLVEPKTATLAVPLTGDLSPLWPVRARSADGTNLTQPAARTFSVTVDGVEYQDMDGTFNLPKGTLAKDIQVNVPEGATANVTGRGNNISIVVDFGNGQTLTRSVVIASE